MLWRDGLRQSFTKVYNHAHRLDQWGEEELSMRVELSRLAPAVKHIAETCIELHIGMYLTTILLFVCLAFLTHAGFCMENVVAVTHPGLPPQHIICRLALWSGSKTCNVM